MSFTKMGKTKNERSLSKKDQLGFEHFLFKYL